jgi:hypothetical protein
MKNIELRRNKMCNDKRTYINITQASRVAEKFNQNVYECPICFCYHTTDRSDWKQEFVSIEKHERLKKEYNNLHKNYMKLKELYEKQI